MDDLASTCLCDLTLSLIGVAVALMPPGYGDLILLAGPCTLAALILLLRALARRITAPPEPEPEWLGLPT